jgi:mitochondrial fission protein ELM1
MMTSRFDRPLIIWRITDGKPGHEKQTLGLARALLKSRPGKCIDLAAPARSEALKQWLLGRFSAGLGLPAPDILLGAGHATHFALLAARRAYGGKAVVLMKPSLPLSWFDLCVIPEHDDPPLRNNVIITRGALNCVIPSEKHAPPLGLILVGGPSPHFQWNTDSIQVQIRDLVRHHSNLRWRLTTSRRTPADFLDALAAPDIECIPSDSTEAGWLESQLEKARVAWVTPDSVSMVYESLTAGCHVGLFDLKAIGGSRVAKGILGLQANGHLVSMSTLSTNLGGNQELPHFNEAERCTGIIEKRWLQ